MKLLVTGGAGFIGANFIHYWLKNHPEDKIINFDKLTYAGNLENLKEVENNKNYRFIKGDIGDGGMVNRAMEGVDTVIHFAAESHVDRSITEPAIFVKTNVLGTQVLLEAASRHKVKRFHHISCYDENTKALTKDGFKKYSEIKKGDLVLSINPQSGKLEWKPVEKVIVQNYEGRMISIKSKTLNLMVTPNHRVLVQFKKSKKFIYKEADQLKREAINKVPKFYTWEGKVPNKLKKYKFLKDFVYLLGIFIGDGFLAYQEKNQLNKTGLCKRDYIRLCRNKSGCFSGGDRIGNKAITTLKSWRIFLDIPENDKCRKRCEEVLSKLNIKWHKHRGKAGEHIYFTSEDLFKTFKECGNGALNKKIPHWALDLPSELLKELFYGLLDSDGSKRRVFYTSSELLASQFLELCIKLNLSPNIATRRTVSYLKKRKIEGTSYVISFRNLWRDIRKNNIKEIFYKGKIWCLKVKDNKNFLTERKGKTLFCGNTDEVFGSLELNSKEKFNEETAFRPNSPYAASKAGSDCLVRAYFKTYGLPVTVTNTSNNFGPYQFPEKFIPLAITNILEGKKVPIYGDGLYVRDWIYVEDHCRAIDLVLQKGKVGETYCVGGATEDIPNIEIIRKILKILGKDESLIEFVNDRPGHDRRYAIDWSKAKRELGYQPQFDLDIYLEKTVEWYKSHQDWWKKVKSGEYLEYYKRQYGTH